MWPWGHLSLGYLVYSVGCRLGGRTVVSRYVAWLVLGTQFPDLVDKPLAWYLDVISGRSLGHSALVAAVIVAAILAVTGRLGRRPVGTAFGVGYATHLLGDALGPLAKGWYAGLTFLAWPVLEPPPYRGPDTLVGHLERLLRTLDGLSIGTIVWLFWLDFLMLGLVVVVWVSDGMPGTGAVREVARRVTGKR